MSRPNTSLTVFGSSKNSFCGSGKVVFIDALLPQHNLVNKQESTSALFCVTVDG